MAVAAREADRALQAVAALPASPWRDALETLARYSHQRSS